MAHAPNILLLITDQQRRPMHWPDDPGWLRQLMPNDQAISDTALTFERAFSAAAMCSPSRASILTSLFPAHHGVGLTLTAGDLKPKRRHSPDVIKTVNRLMRDGTVDRDRLLRAFARGMFDIGPHSGGEPELPMDLPSLGNLLGSVGYHVAYRGKWHLTHALGTPEETGILSGWGEADSVRLSEDYGLLGWEPPDAGENAKAENFGGGNAGRLGVGWDEEYTRQVERFLADENLPEPFCLVVSLVNPHDVLGYPDSYLRGGFRPEEFADLEVGLPESVDEDLSNKPDVHALMQMGATAYMGPVDDRTSKLEYVNFYAHLHRVVDQKIGRILAALGPEDDPKSLRSRTLLCRIADHGEMGMSHGGMRQKMFNAYEETINVPLVVSNPVLFPKPDSTKALVSLIDLLPTFLGVAGAGTMPEVDSMQGVDLRPILSSHAFPGREELPASEVDFSSILDLDPAPSVREAVHFTFDDHQAGTALQNGSGQPNRVRTVRTGAAKWSLYFDPEGKRPNEYELYDLERDPIEVDNLVDYRTGEVRDTSRRDLRAEMGELLDMTMDELGTSPAGAGETGTGREKP